MAGSPIRRSSALIATRALQVASAVVIAGGVGAATMPGFSTRVEGTAPRPQEPVDPQDAPAPERETDWEIITGALAAWDKQPPPVEVPPRQGGTEEPGVQAPAPPNLRFLGAIVEPKRRLAVLAIDDKQKIVAEGQEYGGHKVLEVGDTFARVLVHGAEQRLEKPKASQSMLSSLSTSPMVSPLGSIPGGYPNAMPGYADPEIQRRLDEQGEMARKYAGEGTRAVPIATTPGSIAPGGYGVPRTYEQGGQTYTATPPRGPARAVPVPVSGGTAATGGAADATGGDFDSATGDPRGDGGGAADGNLEDGSSK